MQACKKLTRAQIKEREMAAKQRRKQREEKLLEWDASTWATVDDYYKDDNIKRRHYDVTNKLDAKCECNDCVTRLIDPIECECAMCRATS